MEIRARDLKIKDLFDVRSEVFEIPIYQRRYSWDISHWTDLWNDLLETSEDDYHFIGSIVVISSEHQKGLNYFEVVDGQQRITTLMIILYALKNIYEERGNTESATYLKNLLYSEYISDKSNKLILGKLDQEDFNNLINKSNKNSSKHSNILSSYEYFYNKIKEHKSLDEIRDKLLGNIRVVLISAFNHKDAFRLFETLNDRGLALSAVDLIKNCILRKFAELGDEEILKEAIKQWDELINNLTETDPIVFLRQYYLATKESKISKSKIYEKYKELIDNNKDLYNYLLDLNRASSIYKNITSQETESKDLNDSLRNLEMIKASTSYTIILRLILDEIEFKEISSIIRLIEKFSLRISICSWSTADMETIYLEIIKNYSKVDNKIEFIKDILKKNSPSDEEFIKSFKNTDFRQNDQTKYILEYIEYYKTKNTEEKTIADRSKVHIEHIMPQNINAKKSKKEFGDWETYLGSEAELHNEYVSKIGNLSLLGAKLNIIASNNPFEEKKKNYQKSNILMTKELCNYNEWKIKQIKERTDQMSKEAIMIWSY